MALIARKEEAARVGRVIVYGNLNYEFDREQKMHVPTDEDDKHSTVEILDIEKIDNGRVITWKYVLPLSDAAISTNEDGLVYSYNCSLPYLRETAHLAEVEHNQIVSQAFLYAGRSNQPAKANLGMIVLIGVLGLLAVIGMFK